MNSRTESQDKDVVEVSVFIRFFTKILSLKKDEHILIQTIQLKSREPNS